MQFRRQLRSFPLNLLTDLVHKTVYQQCNIFVPLTQGRQLQVDHIQTVIQILPESSFFNQLFQMVAGCSDHSYVDMSILVTADRRDRVIFQNPQQLGLRFQFKITDLIDKQSTMMGCFKTSPTGFRRAGKRTFRMTEQFALDQVFRNGGHIHGHKRFCCPRAVTMNGLGNQFFSCA